MLTQMSTELIHYFITWQSELNSQHFADHIFKSIFFNERVLIRMKISPKFICKDPVDNISGLAYHMTYHMASLGHNE